VKVIFEVLSYWRVGSGFGQAGSLDATCARDQDGLPYIPGRQVRGLFREALNDAIDLGWFDGDVAAYFGTSQSATMAKLSDTKPGSLRFENARLPENDRQALRAKADGELISRLFATKRSTAIDAQTGTAQKRSLRFTEVAIPMILQTEVTPLANAPENWKNHLQKAAPLIRGIGNGRNRGLGRVIVTCENSGGDNA
jgi:CRISPR/Cas system CSM-associated protein Csm3 (group 7 of RAMP superfamily)